MMDIINCSWSIEISFLRRCRLIHEAIDFGESIGVLEVDGPHGAVFNGFGPVRFAEKTSRNTIPADLLREKNTISIEKRRIIKEANMTIMDRAVWTCSVKVVACTKQMQQHLYVESRFNAIASVVSNHHERK